MDFTGTCVVGLRQKPRFICAGARQREPCWNPRGTCSESSTRQWRTSTFCGTRHVHSCLWQLICPVIATHQTTTYTGAFLFRTPALSCHFRFPVCHTHESEQNCCYQRSFHLLTYLVRQLMSEVDHLASKYSNSPASNSAQLVFLHGCPSLSSLITSFLPVVQIHLIYCITLKYFFLLTTAGAQGQAH